MSSEITMKITINISSIINPDKEINIEDIDAEIIEQTRDVALGDLLSFGATSGEISIAHLACSWDISTSNPYDLKQEKRIEV
jgi:hypothetical protein